MATEIERRWDYLAENLAVSSLIREAHPDTTRRKSNPETLLWPIAEATKGLRNRIVWKFGSLVKKWDTSKLDVLRNSGTGRAALLVANGPSQDFLDRGVLERFIADGHDLFLLNYFSENTKYAGLERFHYVTSDPLSLVDEPHRKVLAPLANSEGLFFCPFSEEKRWNEIVPGRQVVAFCDTQARVRFFSRRPRISPIEPRTYGSWTALKALSIAHWMGFDVIYLIGLDNTYPREIFSDSMNSLLTLERHGGNHMYLADRTKSFSGVSDYLFEIYRLFRDLEEFSGIPVVNLDPYSLTTVFPKLSRVDDIASQLATPLARWPSMGGSSA